jgi:hypothetical protein
MQNVGSIDRVIRVVVGLALLSLWFLLDGNLRFVALVGLVPLLTAAIGLCPLYSLIKVKTNGAKPSTESTAGKAAA